MLTVVGPAISAWLVATEYANFVPFFARSHGIQAAILASLLIKACSVAFGVFAGIRLWLIRPKAVSTAKQALLVGLAADVVTATIEVVTAQVQAGNDRLLYQVEVNLIPSLIFFTLCFAYLNRSKRVYATYESHSTGA